MQDVTVRNYSSTFDAKRLGPQAIEVFQRALEDLLHVRQGIRRSGSSTCSTGTR
jgi:hypothetical protein